MHKLKINAWIQNEMQNIENKCIILTYFMHNFMFCFM